MTRSLLLALSLSALAGAASAQALHTVKPDGSADFLTIQAAVDASAPGDVVLVLGGLHENVSITRGLTLLTSGGVGITKAASGPGALLPALAVTGLPEGEHVVISGLSFFIGAGGAPATITITDCAGPVWLQDLFVDSYGSGSLIADGAASVVIDNTVLQTNLVTALPDGTPLTGAGAEAHGGTHLWGYTSQLRGSHGALQGGVNPAPNAPPDGGAGLVVVDALAHWSGGSIMGGPGNSLVVEGCLTGGNGGAGLLVVDDAGALTPAVELSGTAVTGGSGGFHAACAPDALPGPAIDAPPGVVNAAPAPARKLLVPGWGQGGSTVTLGLQGAAGDAAFLLVSLAAAPGFTAAQVDLHLSLDALVALLPFALPGGALNIPVALPVLPAGLQALVVPMQAVFVDGQGARHAANPRALAIL